MLRPATAQNGRPTIAIVAAPVAQGQGPAGETHAGAGA